MSDKDIIFGSAGTYRSTTWSGNLSSFSATGSSYSGINTASSVKNIDLNVFTLLAGALPTASQPTQIISTNNTISSPFSTYFTGSLSSYGYSNLLSPSSINGFPGVFHHYNISPTFTVGGKVVSSLSSSSASKKTEIIFGTYTSYTPAQRESNSTGQNPNLDFLPQRQSDVTYSRDIVTEFFTRY